MATVNRNAHPWNLVDSRILEMCAPPANAYKLIKLRERMGELLEFSSILKVLEPKFAGFDFDFFLLLQSVFPPNGWDGGVWFGVGNFWT